MNLSKTMVSKKVLFTKKEKIMKKAIAIQAIIFIIAYFTMTPDILEDNTHVFGLFGSYDVIPGNTVWVLAGAAVLSVLNIWLWWPKARKVVNTSCEKAQEVTNAETDKAEEKDPVVPKMD